MEIADYDIKTAKALLTGKRFLYVGFMCHQVIEKNLKAYYIFNLGKIPPFTHSLSQLAKLNRLYTKFSTQQKDFLDTLEPLNIQARYPTSKVQLIKNLNENKCKQI